MKSTHPGASVDTADLVSMYKDGLSLNQIAQRVPLTAGGIRMRLIKAGCRLRHKNQGMAAVNRSPVPTALLIERYLAGESTNQIARSVGLAGKTVVDRLRRANVPRRTRADYGGKSGPSNPNWRGGRWMNGNGYVRITLGGRSEFEHRFVMAKVLGRPLTRNEHVHHINGIRTDNRPENLIVTTPDKHESRTLIKALQRRICYLEAVLQDK